MEGSMEREHTREPATPEATPRTVVDDRGRRWSGQVTSGRMGGGETYAEVIFACEDQPSEPKRVSRLNEPPARAGRSWRGMRDDELREVFDRSMPS
jgi:hypothetical protein